jgi:Uma2 family endonuclease
MAEKIKMTSAEYFKLPETNQKMELIEGELIVAPSPVPKHQKVAFALAKFLDQLKPNGQVIIAPMDVEFDIEDVYQPDIFWIAEDGKALETEGNYIGAPDLIVEVLSPGTAKYDKGKKFNVYEKYGVREYWLADPEGAYLEVWILKDKKFARLGVFDKDDTFDSPALGKKVELKGIF